MRMEKSFGTWAREYRPIYGPFEAGLGRFVDFKKGEFIGRAAAAEEKESGGALRLVDLRGRCGGCRRASAMSRSGTMARSVGWVTSGAYGHRVGQPRWPWATCRRRWRKADAGFEIEIIGERHKAQRLAAAAFDSGGALMRT